MKRQIRMITMVMLFLFTICGVGVYAHESLTPETKVASEETAPIDKVEEQEDAKSLKIQEVLYDAEKTKQESVEELQEAEVKQNTSEEEAETDKSVEAKSQDENAKESVVENTEIKETESPKMNDKQVTDSEKNETQSQNNPAGQNENINEAQAEENKNSNPVEKTEDKPEVKSEVNKDDKDLKEIEDKIKAEQNPAKKAELQKEYNKKYLEKLGSSEKLDKEVLKRFTDNDKTKKYYELKDEYDKLKEKAENDKLSQKELKEITSKIDKLNEELGAYKVPRLLDPDEKDAQDKLNHSIDEPSLNDESTDPDAQGKLDAYNNAKKALKDALNPDNARTKSEKELKELLEAFEKADKDLKAGIGSGKIKLNYTKDGSPTVRVFPLVNGSLGKEMTNDPNKNDKPYYIPDNTDINLLLHINKDDEPKKFTFTIKAIDKGAVVDNEKASNLAFLNGNPVELKDNGDGTYTFTVDSDKTFGIAQLRFNIPGFKGAFHNGFDLEMDLNGKKVTKQFRITKKGYEDEAHLSGPGSNTDKDPKAIPEIDAGKTENAVVSEDTDRVHDFFSYLKKSNTYIDDVTFNSGNGESLPLDSVDITITVPKSGKDNFAKMIHKSGLEYHDLGKGKYQLKLNTKVFKGNLTKLPDGKLMYNGKALTKANLNDIVLENAGKKVYVKGEKTYDVNTREVLDGENYQVKNGKLYEKKNGSEDYTEIGSFNEGKLVKDGKTYLLKGDKLIIYTSEHDVYDGYVTNKDGEADTEVTPTYEGNQVTIEKNGETSYGGTIVTDAIYDKNGKIFKEDGYTGQEEEEKIIDSTGKIDNTVQKPNDENIKEVKDSNGKLLYKYFVDNEKTYRIVNNAVFKDGYIVDGLEYKKGLSLIDKFGKKMNVDVTKDGETYKFTRKVVDKKNNTTKEEIVKSGEDEANSRKVHVSDADKKQILVNNKNKVVKNDEVNNVKPYEIVGPKYYYDGKKFVEAHYKTIYLNKTIQNTYNDGKKDIVIDGKNIYQGSLNPNDYYSVNDKVYVKKGDIYISAKADESSDILTEKTIAKIVQTLGNIEKVTDEVDIFSAIQNAKFALRFPGFLAGKNIVYNLHAEVKATYKEPKQSKEGEFEEKSIFKNGVKTIDKYFTLKNENIVSTKFNKKGPEVLKADPKVNLHFFNIFYRNAGDRDRDKIIADLLNVEDEVNKAEKAFNEATSEADKKDKKKTYENLKKDNKEKLELLAKFKNELNRLKDGAKFALTNDKRLAITDKEGNAIDIDRSILWELSFKNDEGALFPDNKDSEIVIEDHNMDNRLVYDEIIVNDTEEKWNGYKKAYEDAQKAYEDAKKVFDNADQAGKEAAKIKLDKAKTALDNAKFEGKKEYFFLDQIKDIRFGVNPNFVEGRFVPLGDNFKLTGEQIIKELGDNNETTIKINGIEFKITRDKAKGQVRIKVMDAFYKKNNSYNKDDENNNYKFYSPAQKEYQDKMNTVINGADDLNASSTTKLKNSFKDLIKELHTTETNCYGILTKKFEELMTEVDKISDDTEKANKLNEIKKTLSDEIKKLELKYLDTNKGAYKNDDMRFNSIRIGLKPGITIGGPLSPLNSRKIGITSVIVPELDIPYTDEYGSLLTNKDMYVKQEIENILNNGIDQGEGKAKLTFDRNNWFKSEESFGKVMEEAYRIVNDKIERKEIEIKELVTIDKNKKKVGMEKYTVVKGSDLDYKDLAVNNQSLKNHNGFAINPWYIGEGDKHESIKQRFTKQFGTGKFESKDEYKTLQDKAIDIAAYYMSKQGYDRSRFANKANYKLDKDDAKEGLFPSVKDWKRKNCYPGIGFCIEEAGKDLLPGSDQEEGKFGALFSTEDFFELSYDSTNKGPDEEHPHTDKSSKKDPIDISDEKEKEIDFTIDVTVDKMTKEQREIADALKPKKDESEMTPEEKAKAKADKERKEIEDKNFKDNGYYEYKNSLIIDFLPEVFKLKEGTTKLIFTADSKKLMANGANNEFENDKKFNDWKSKIEYFHTDDILAYAKTLGENDPRKAVLDKAIAEAKASGKIKDGQKVQAVLAWLPNFEAPHGSTGQFKFELKNLVVDKKKFKDFNDGVYGTNYTNHAAFGDNAKFYFGDTTVNIYKDKHGKVNKYLQLLDEKNNIIDEEKAGGWFKGNAELKFGDKFNYRIEYKNDNNIVQVPGEAHKESEINIKDIFADVKVGGLRPVLRDYITSDLDKDKYEVIYKIGDTKYTEASLKAAIEANEVKMSDVTSVILKGSSDNGAINNFDIPMMIPELDAKIKDGKVFYIGTDGKEHELGDADKFFNLKSLLDPNKDLAFENKVEESNTVTVYLKKNRFIRLFKEFFDANGEEIKKNRPEMTFDIYQYQTDKDGKPIKDANGNIIKVKVLDKDGKPLQLVVNEKNNFTDMKSNLPLFNKTITVDKDGNVTETVTNYKYELVENDASGYNVKFEILDNGKDQLGFVLKAKNTEKPEKPGNPPENPPHNPPEEPKNPPEEPNTPPEKPNEPPTPEVPETPEEPNGGGKINIPKTGVRENVVTLWMSGLLLLALVLMRRKLFKK